MGISEAIARVRRGATRSRAGLLEGALSYLGVRLKADIATRLKSDSVPPPLRPLATRLASLIKLSDPPPYDDSARQQLEVVSLDRALVRAAHEQQHAPTAAAAHPAGDVCPFTGLRADGSLAEAPPVQPVSPEANAAGAEASAAGPAGAQAVDDLAAATRLPIPTAANDASSVVSTAIAGSGEFAAAPAGPGEAEASGPRAQAPKKSAAKRPPGQAAGEKRKEKLAGSENVTNTPARSATRPVKQPGGKGQTSSRKRRDSGL